MKPPNPRFRKKPLPARPKSEDDLWLDRLRRECTLALVNHLKDSVNTLRPIKTLTLAELDNMVEAVTAQWIVSVSRKRAEPEPTQAMVDALSMLI